MDEVHHAQPTPSPVAGNGLFANRSIGAGEAIVALRRPMVAVLDYPRLSDTCSNCFLQAHDNDWFAGEPIVISACAGCKAVRYCSKNDFPPGYHSHVKQESANAPVGTETVEDSLKKIMTNALTLVKWTFDPLGIAFDPLICSANHSCDPNAVVTFDGSAVSLRSLRPIAKDEEVFITYIDCTNPYTVRQEELRDRYGFICACSKCQRKGSDETQTTVSPSSSRAIRKPDRRFAAMFNGGAEPVTEGTFSTLDGDLFAHLERARSKTEDMEALSICQMIIRQVPSFTQQPSAAARDELFARACSMGQFLVAMAHGIRRYFDIDPILYPVAFHPVRVVHAWALVKLLMGMYSNPEDESTKALVDQNFEFLVPIWRLLKELATLVDCSHGTGTRMEMEVKSLLMEVEKGITVEDPKDLDLIKADPGRHWKAFEDLKYNLDTFKL
ncbi:hypothetical protein MBLNU457_5269t2 [Dothideomycetes sp. NU457]